MLRLLRALLIFVVAALALSALSIAIARATLPVSPCTVDTGKYDALKLEIRHAAVVAQLGCDGVPVSRRLLGESEKDGIVEEVLAWRGTCWPYQAIRLRFFNRVLHEKTELKLCLAATFPKWLGGSG